MQKLRVLPVIALVLGLDQRRFLINNILVIFSFSVHTSEFKLNRGNSIHALTLLLTFQIECQLRFDFFCNVVCSITIASELMDLLHILRCYIMVAYSSWLLLVKSNVSMTFMFKTNFRCRLLDGLRSDTWANLWGFINDSALTLITTLFY